MVTQKANFSRQDASIGYVDGGGNGWYRVLQCTSTSPAINGIQFKLHTSNMYMYTKPNASSFIFTSGYDIANTSQFYYEITDGRDNKIKKFRVVRDTTTNAIYFDIKVYTSIYDTNSNARDLWIFTLENVLFRIFRSADGTMNWEPNLQFKNGGIRLIARDDTLPANETLLKEFDVMRSVPNNEYIHIEGTSDSKNLNDYIVPGKYVCRGDSVAGEFYNTPAPYNGTQYGYPNTFTLYVVNTLGTTSNGTNAGYISQFLMYCSYGVSSWGTRIFSRCRVAGNWTTWKSFNTSLIQSTGWFKVPIPTANVRTEITSSTITEGTLPNDFRYANYILVNSSQAVPDHISIFCDGNRLFITSDKVNSSITVNWSYMQTV